MSLAPCARCETLAMMRRCSGGWLITDPHDCPHGENCAWTFINPSPAEGNYNPASTRSAPRCTRCQKSFLKKHAA